MSKKNIIPKEYRDSNNLVRESQFFGYLKRNEISLTEALEIIIKETTIDTSHPRTQWKLERFQWYLWERDKEWRDGTKSGYDVDLLKSITECTNIPVIASGGVGTLDHLYDGIVKGGASAVLAASIFHYGEFKIKEAKEYLNSKNVSVRL